MLKVTIHAGPSKDANMHNRLDWLDIAYENLAPIADYKIAFFQDGFGAFCPATLKSYPRWSGSIWDLVMRSILVAQNTESAAHGVSECVQMSKSEFGLEQFPTVEQIEKKFAYATHVSAFITHYPGRQGSDIRLIGTADIQMVRGKGNYVATFTEHAGNELTTGVFSFKPPLMDVSLHLANAIAIALGGKPFETPARPVLETGSPLSIGGTPHIRLSALREPAQTGFSAWTRLSGIPAASHDGHNDWFPEKDYLRFVGGYI